MPSNLLGWVETWSKHHHVWRPRLQACEFSPIVNTNKWKGIEDNHGRSNMPKEHRLWLIYPTIKRNSSEKRRAKYVPSTKTSPTSSLPSRAPSTPPQNRPPPVPSLSIIFVCAVISAAYSPTIESDLKNSRRCTGVAEMFWTKSNRRAGRVMGTGRAWLLRLAFRARLVRRRRNMSGSTGICWQHTKDNGRTLI